MTRRTPAYGGTPEAERLARIHDRRRPDSDIRQIAAKMVGFDRRLPPCDECESGDTPVDGFHLVYADEWDILGTWKVPCPRDR